MQYNFTINATTEAAISLMNFLKTLSYISFDKEIEKKSKKSKIDTITLISEATLAEEWNSKEDQEWDKIL